METLIISKASIAAPQRPRQPWGFFATCAWILASAVLATLLTALLVLGLAKLFSLQKSEIELLVSIGILAFFMAFLMLAAHLRGWRPLTYVALVTPKKRYLLQACALLIIQLGLSTALVYFTDAENAARDQNWVVESYQQAQGNGKLVLWLFNILVCAPVIEELVFRGFIYRGWSSSFLGPRGAIAFSALLFGLIHLQYSWVGIMICAVNGAFLGWLRWQSQSCLPSMLNHTLLNLVAVLLTIADTAK